MNYLKYTEWYYGQIDREIMAFDYLIFDDRLFYIGNN